MDEKIKKNKFIRRIDFYVNLFFKSALFVLIADLIIGIVWGQLIGIDSGAGLGIGILVFYISLILGIVFFIVFCIRYEKERFKNKDYIIAYNINATSAVDLNKISKHNKNYLIVLITYVIVLVFGLLFFHTRKSEFVILLTLLLLLISLIIKKK